MAGFVECLESEEAEEGAEKVEGERNILWCPYSCCSNAAAAISLCQCCQTQNIVFSKMSRSDKLWHKKGFQNPAWNPSPHPKPANYLLGNEDTQLGPVSFGLRSQETCVVHHPSGSGSEYSSALCPTVALNWSLLSDCHCTDDVKQACWVVRGAACTPFWVCYKEAQRRGQDLYLHNRHLTWPNSATR